jgi:hypothetical protein
MSANIKFSEQQIAVMKEIMKTMSGIEMTREECGIRWTTLLAQMQSGKTETYLLIACELLYVERVEEVVIFSGNAETDLKDQLVDIIGGVEPKFWRKYRRYLEEECGIDRYVAEDLTDKMKQKFQVVWGPELKKYNGPTSKVLWIWEESHHAQTVNQCPDKFLRNIGISATGDFVKLIEKNNFVLSVSATPFSELSDNHHHAQNKKIAYMRPGAGYTSVRKIRDSERLRHFDNVTIGLTQALNIPHSSPKYAIVRITNKNEETVKAIIKSNGWKCVVYDSVSTGQEKVEGKRVWDGMRAAPQVDTAILLRGKCRMGKNLEKKHILFVMETARQSRTDTVLQGLLGRVCGYSEGSDRIVVYLHTKIVSSKEIDRYITMIDELETTGEIKILPKRANNLTEAKVKTTDPIIPMKITRDRTISSTNDRPKMLEDIYHAFNNNVRIANGNDQRVYDEVRNKVMSAYNGDRSKLKIHKLDINNKGTRGVEKAVKLMDAFAKGETILLGSGCGIDSEGLEVNIWFPKNIPGMNNDEIYITAHVTKIDASPDQVPLTTGREVFRYQTEDGVEIESNGSFSVQLSKETAVDKQRMASELRDIISLSLSIPNNSRKVASCWDHKDKVSKGIIVSQEVYKALEKGGAIYNDFKALYGVELNIKKTGGPIPKEISQKGCLRLASITW